MTVHGYISAYDGESLTIVAPFVDSYILEKRQITECEIRLDDGRHISAQQRKKIYATLRDISLWSGHDPEELKALTKYDFLAKTGGEYFSLSNVDMTTANEYLNHLIEFCLQWDIPCAESLLKRSPDIARYVYACMVHKRCAVCGKKAELHHVDAVGSGRNRREIVHLGMRVLPLCRIHHTEIHNIGRESFLERYKLETIRIDQDLCEIWKLNRRQKDV